MSSNRPGDEAPFTWPPAAADLDRIDILDVSQPADMPVAEAASAPEPPRLHHRGRSRSRSRARTMPRATGQDGWLLLASGVLIGAMLPGLVRVHTTASTPQQTGASTPTAPALPDVVSEGAALRAMQALLRGDTAATVRMATSTTTPVRPAVRIGPTGDVDQLPIPQPTVLPSRTGTPATTAPPERRPAARRASAASAAKARTSTNTRDVAVRRVLEDYERAWTRWTPRRPVPSGRPSTPAPCRRSSDR